jgi:hypothetical protein
VLERHLTAELLGAATGRRYQIDVKKLDGQEQQELLRLIRDLKEEVASVKRQARTQPWRFAH